MKTKLTAENINASVRQAEEYLLTRSGESTTRTKVLLWLEETLLTYRDRMGEDGEYILQMGGITGSKLKLLVDGEMFDAFADNGDPERNSPLMRTFLIRLEQRPVWRYSYGQNEIVFVVPRKHPSDTKILLRTALTAAVLGLLFRFLPQSVSSGVVDSFIQPVMDTFVGFLNAVATPMIFLSVVWGIYSMGDSATFSRLGKKVCGKYMLMQLLISAAAAGLSVLAFRLQMGASGATGIFGTVFSMLLDIVPDNLLTPFTTGNTLQVLFFAVLFGTTMIIVADKVQYVAAFSEQLNCVIQAIMGFIGQLVPAFIFGSIFTLTVSSDFSTLRVCSHFAIAGLVAAVLVFAVQVTVTALKLHIPPRVLKKILPVFMVGLGTGSSAAAFSANLECSVKGFGMSEKLAGFGIPMGQIMYKPCTNLGYFLAAVSVAEFTGTGVSVEWIISAALIALILSIATPSAAGAPMACFYVIFSQLGLSGEQLALIVAVDAVLDFVFTGVNVFGVQCVLLTVAKQLDMLDFDTASGLSAKAQ